MSAIRGLRGASFRLVAAIAAVLVPLPKTVALRGGCSLMSDVARALAGIGTYDQVRHSARVASVFRFGAAHSREEPLDQLKANDLPVRTPTRPAAVFRRSPRFSSRRFRRFRMRPRLHRGRPAGRPQQLTAPTMSQIFGPVWFLPSSRCEASSSPGHLVRVASVTLSSRRSESFTRPAATLRRSDQGGSVVDTHPGQHPTV